MYQSLLTRRYLTSKVMPLLASFAVLLCVATELIVWSVMGGFLTMLLDSGRMFMGDVSISWPNTGFAHYDDLVKRLKADPLVKGAAPTIETLGLLSLPVDGQVETVLVKGIESDSFHEVTEYRNTLHWKPLDKPVPQDRLEEDIRLDRNNHKALEDLLRFGGTLTFTDPDTGETGPGIVLGSEVSGYNDRKQGGLLDPMIFLPGRKVMLSVLPLDKRGRLIDAASVRIPVANEFVTGFYEADANTLLAPLDQLQRLLHMDEARSVPRPAYIETDQVTGEDRLVEPEAVSTDPARVTSVLVRGTGTDTPRGLAALKQRCAEIYADFAAAHPDVPAAATMQVRTWEDRNRTLIAAVKKEIGLVMFVFGLISITSVFLVFSIFWSMVSEKTKDIGVLRALGASRAGVLWLWVRYGLWIGLVGSVLGLAAAYLIVTNINPIHDWIGRTTASLFGEAFYIWDPKVYVFTEIPNKVEPLKAAIIVVSGVLASTLGALIPAGRAAAMRPVRALRFE